jgi:hypothetical protein
MDPMNPVPVVVDTPPNVATGSAGSTMWVAVVRSLWSAVAAGLLAGFTAYQTMEGTMPDEDALRKALIVAGIAVFGPIAARGGAEGVWDASRQKSGNATPADVTPRPIP